MKFPLCLVPLAFLSACATQPTPGLVTTQQVPMLPVEVAGTALEAPESVRTEEALKSYPHGRYVDPGDANVMHEAGVIHRVEQSPEWNLRPNGPQNLDLGPVTARRDEAAANNPYTAELEQLFKQQQQYMAAIIEQNDATSKALATVQEKAAALEETRQEQARLKTQLEGLAQDNQQLRQELEEARKPKPEAARPWWKFWQ
jgi:hypothetical protein